MPKTLTADCHIINCLLALSYWAEVKPSSVSLGSWKCGTHACFGGHLATWPDFRAMGIVLDTDWGPVMGDNGIDGFEVAYELFGDKDLFDVAFCPDVDFNMPDDTRDYDLIINRLETRIEELTS